MSSVTSISMVEALSRIRTGALLMIIASILSGISGILMFTMFLPTLLSPRDIYALTINFLTNFIIFLGLAFIGFVLTLIAIYAMIVPGTRKLAQINPEYSTSSKLISIGYVWGIIILIIALVIIIVGLFTVFPSIVTGGYIEAMQILAIFGIGGLLGLIGTILFIIGFIGLIMLTFKLHSLEQNALYLVAGILFIIGIFISITVFISWILMYIALGQSIERYRSRPTPFTQIST